MRATPSLLGLILSIAVIPAASAENVDVNGFSSFVAPLQPAFPTGPDGRPKDDGKAASAAPAPAADAEPAFKSAIQPLSPAFEVTKDGKLASKAPPAVPSAPEPAPQPTPGKAAPNAQAAEVAPAPASVWQLPHEDVAGTRLGMDFEAAAKVLFARSDDWIDLAKPPAPMGIRIAYSPRRSEAAAIVRGTDGKVAAVGRLVALSNLGVTELRTALALKYGIAFSTQANAIVGFDEIRPLGSPVCQPVWSEFFKAFGPAVRPNRNVAIPLPVPTAQPKGRCGPMLIARTGTIDGRTTLIIWLIAPERLPSIAGGSPAGTATIEF